MKRNQSKLMNTVLGIIAGSAAGILANGVIPAGGGMTTTIVNGVKLIGGAYLALSQKNSMYMAGGLALAAQGAGEIVAQYVGGNPDTYQGPSLFGFPGVYTSPSYFMPYGLNGVGALGDAGVSEQMRY